MILIDRMGCAYKSVYHGTEVRDPSPLPIPSVRWSNSVKNRVATKRYEIHEDVPVQAEPVEEQPETAEEAFSDTPF